METLQNARLIRAYLDAVAEDKEKAMDRYVADQALRDHIIMFEEGLPNYQVHEEDLIVHDDKVVLRAQLIGTHAGTLFGVPPSGKNVKVHFIIIYRISGGKIVEHWQQADTLALMQQIGAVRVSQEQE